MSSTPRTDAAEKFHEGGAGLFPFEYVDSEVARQLESELAGALEGRKQLHTQLLTAEAAASDAVSRLREAFKIIEVLHMDALDNNQESWPRAAAWLEHNKIFNPSNQPKEDHEKN